jgi:uroporphyrin-III C-methyltransferase
MPGKVFLVGAGPGDPELLTVKALKLLREAKIVLHDDLIGPEVLRLIPPSAHVQNVGKRCGRKGISQEEINAWMVNYALLELNVVRLKGGDPSIFGRTGEEIAALRRAKIEFEIVPGVTAALGAAAAAEISLTHREIASSVLAVPNHHAKDSSHWPAQIPRNTTVVIYMPGHQFAETAERLKNSGVPERTPCAIISQATSPEQHIHLTTVENLPSSPNLPAPALLVVGEVVRFAKQPGALQSNSFGNVFPWEAEFITHLSLREQEQAE